MNTANVYSIAIADDHKEVREGIASLLKQMDYEIIIAAPNGKELIESIRHCKAPPEICIVDMTMPIMGGLVTIAALKNEWPQMIVIASSASAKPHNMDTLKKAGANHFYQKGAPLKKLINLFSTSEFSVVIP